MVKDFLWACSAKAGTLHPLFTHTLSSYIFKLDIVDYTLVVSPFMS
jgi:hypothetical protein